MKWSQLISRDGPTHDGIIIDDYTSVEVYFASGITFLLGFALSIVLTVMNHIESMVWFGWGATIVVTAIVFFALRARELRQRAASGQTARPGLRGE